MEEQWLGAAGVYSPEAPAPTAKGGLRADKHFLPPRRGGLGRDVVVSGSQGATALVKVRQGPVRLYRLQTPVGWGGLPGWSGRAALWPPMPSPGLDHARIALFSMSQERGSSLGRGAEGPGAPSLRHCMGLGGTWGGLSHEPWRWQHAGTAGTSGTALGEALPWLGIDFPIFKCRNENQPIASWKRLEADDWNQRKLNHVLLLLHRWKRWGGQNEEQLSASASLHTSTSAALLATGF